MAIERAAPYVLISYASADRDRVLQGTRTIGQLVAVLVLIHEPLTAEELSGRVALL